MCGRCYISHIREVLLSISSAYHIHLLCKMHFESCAISHDYQSKRYENRKYISCVWRDTDSNSSPCQQDLWRLVIASPLGQACIGYTRDLFLYYGPDIIHHTHPKSMVASTKLPSMPTIGHRHLESRSREKGKPNFTCI